MTQSPAPERAESAPDLDTLYPQIGEISEPGLAEKVRAIWADIWSRSNWADFEEMPTTPEITYPARPHSQCVVDLALAVASSLERYHGTAIDRDHLIAAAILQDASKVIEYAPDGNCGAEFSAAGRNYPHAFLAAVSAYNHGLPDALVNSVLLHTPQAASFPRTLEGKILYYVDQIDVLAIHGDRWRKELVISK